MDMAEITRERFKVIGKNTKSMESISRPNIGYWQDAWRRIRKNRIAFFSLCLIGLYILLARVSLTIGFAASIINACIGSILGGISGFYGGKVDMLIQRIVDVLYGIPSMIVTILLMVVIGNGVHCLIIAMCMVGWIGSCRFVRGEVLKLRESDFVAAARILGVPDMVIIIKHILPNIMGLIITNLTMAIPGAIFQEAFLSYIGLGIKPPGCSWGVLAKEGIAQLRIHPYQVVVPAVLICTTMLALNLLGDGLRDAFDPKLRGTE